jgi:hypothetical protein
MMTLAKSMWLVAHSSENVGAAAPCTAADRQKRETVCRSDPNGEAGPNSPPNLTPGDTFASVALVRLSEAPVDVWEGRKWRSGSPAPTAAHLYPVPNESAEENTKQGHAGKRRER